MGILTKSDRGSPIHVCTVGAYHYYRHAAMGEKIATQSFSSEGCKFNFGFKSGWSEVICQNCDGVSSER